MINNISFSGHARIDTKAPEKEQLKLYDAITTTKNTKSIKNDLPEDVEIKYSAQIDFQDDNDCVGGVVGGKIEFINYIAEFFKGEKKIGKSSSGRGGDFDADFVKSFVENSITKCSLEVDKINDANEKQSIIEKIKSNDGQVV